jgi:hypothetical protein
MCDDGGPREARPSKAARRQAWMDRRPPLGDGGRRSRVAATLQKKSHNQFRFAHKVGKCRAARRLSSA